MMFEIVVLFVGIHCFAANFPPVFSSTQSSVLYALIGQELNIALNVTDPEGKAVRFNVDTVINQTEWQMSTGKLVSVVVNVSCAPFSGICTLK